MSAPAVSVGDEAVPAGHHRLHSRWAFWYQKKAKRAAGAWYDGIACLGSFSTVEGFWGMYSHILRPDTVAGGLDFMLFREGIQPMWEDPANAKGGKFSIKVRKGAASIMWEELLLALIGEQLDDSADICGAVLSMRYNDDNLTLWNRNAEDKTAVERHRESLVRTLHLPRWNEPTYSMHGYRHRHGGGGGEAGGDGTGGTAPPPVTASLPTAPGTSAGPAGVPVGTAPGAAAGTDGDGKWGGWGKTGGTGATTAPTAPSTAAATVAAAMVTGGKMGAWGKPAAAPALPPATGGPTTPLPDASSSPTAGSSGGTPSSWAAVAHAGGGPKAAPAAAIPVAGGGGAGTASSGSPSGGKGHGSGSGGGGSGSAKPTTATAGGKGGGGRQPGGGGDGGDDEWTTVAGRR